MGRTYPYRHDGLLKDAIEGRLEGKRPRGRKRIMMLDSIKGREPYQRMKERAQYIDKDRVITRYETC